MLNVLGGPGILDGKGTKVKIKPGQELDLKGWQEFYKVVDPNSIKRKIGILSEIPVSFYDNEQQKGFNAVLKKFTNVEVASKIPSDWNRQKGVTAGENIVQNHKDLNAIWTASNEMALGAFNSIDNAGLTGKVLVTTNDGTPESIERIKEGEILTETWHGFPEWMGVWRLNLV